MSDGGRSVDTVTRWLARGGPLPIDPLAGHVLASTVEARLFGASEAGFDLGRYRVERRIGQGGGGTVYRGFDPELARPVAIKVLHASRHDVARLRREAEALARVSHPNVLEIYDVLAPSPERVVLVTAWIDGCSLADWLASSPRDTPEILATFVAVARGLAAVHAAGLVHRDVKPSNVLLGAGTIVLADFGLAQPACLAATIELEEAEGPPTACMVGTPGYMAPEQRDVACDDAPAVDARADQFSFCASLFEALCGELPPRTDDDRCDRAAAAALLHTRRVPGRVRRALLRGLAEDPRERFADMHALVAEVAPRASRRGRVLAGVALALVGTAVAGMLAPVEAQDECAHAATRVAAIWTHGSAEVRAAFGATGAPYADASFARVDDTLARYGASWRDRVLAACDDSIASDERSRRRRCLEQQAWDVESLVRELASADSTLVQRSAGAVFGLSAPRSCDAPADAGLAAWEPDDVEARTHATRLRQRLSEAHARSLAGRWASAATIAAEVVTEAEQLHLAPLALVARIDLGRARVLASELEQGRDELALAYWDAVAGGHDVEAARAASAVGFTAGYKLADIAAGRAWSRHALAALDRLDAHDERRAEVWSHLGSIEALAGNFGEARRWHAQALEIREALASERPDHLASTLNNLGNVDVEIGDYPAARASHERALQLRRDALGEHHPHVATSLNNLGSVLLTAGELDEARATLERALSTWEAILGPDHVDLLGVLHNLTVVGCEVDDLDAAERHAARALAIAEAQLPADHPQLALALTAVALVELERRRPAAALVSFERAHRIAHDALGADHHHTGSAMHGVGLALRDLGRHRGAAAAFSAAHAVLKAALGDGHDLTVTSAKNFATARAKAGV